MIVSVLFGLFHLTNILSGIPPIIVIPQAFYTALLGLVLGYMVIRTNSIIPAILTHYLINSVGKFFYFINYTDDLSRIWFFIIGMGIVPAILGLLFIRFVTPSKKRETNII